MCQSKLLLDTTVIIRHFLFFAVKESNSQIKDLARELNQEQHDLLPLISQKQSLLEEKESLESQLREEEWRRQDLLERFNHVDTEINS